MARRLVDLARRAAIDVDQLDPVFELAVRDEAPIGEGDAAVERAEEAIVEVGDEELLTRPQPCVEDAALFFREAATKPMSVSMSTKAIAVAVRTKGVAAPKIALLIVAVSALLSIGVGGIAYASFQDDLDEDGFFVGY